jgi:N-acetylglucosamine-6-phosphate deacetylase
MLTALTNATLFTGKEIISGKSLLLKDDRIESIIEREAITK